MTKMEENEHIRGRNQNFMIESKRKYMFTIGRFFLFKVVFFGVM